MTWIGRRRKQRDWAGVVKRRGSAEVNGIVERFAYVADPDGYIIELNAQRVLLAMKIKRPLFTA